MKIGDIVKVTLPNIYANDLVNNQICVIKEFCDIETNLVLVHILTGPTKGTDYKINRDWLS